MTYDEIVERFLKEKFGENVYHTADPQNKNAAQITIFNNPGEYNLQYDVIIPGRLSSLQVTQNRATYEFINVYGPAQRSEKKNVHIKVIEALSERRNWVIGGDFNVPAKFTENTNNEDKAMVNCGKSKSKKMSG